MVKNISEDNFLELKKKTGHTDKVGFSNSRQTSEKVPIPR